MPISQSEIDYYLMLKASGHLDQYMEDQIVIYTAGQELTASITDPLLQHEAFLMYLRMRENGESPSMAAMLALGKAPLGIVK